MKKLLAGVVSVGLVITAAWSQDVRVTTRPKPPSREVLDRLDLTQAWRVKLPTEGPRDGLMSVQVIPGPTPKDSFQVVVQTLHGSVILLDGETGDTLWR